jgi:type VI secretion system lysozyme-like protein
VRRQHESNLGSVAHQPTRGSRPLLFERLVGPGRPAATLEHVSADRGPPRLHDADDLRASIERELRDLLNTRVPLAIQQIEQRPRTAIDYGIPDLSAFPVGQHDAMDRLAKHVRDAIAVYEPRLHNPTVEIARDSQNADALTLLVRGTIEPGAIHNMPVTFELLQTTNEVGDDAA